MDAFNKQEVAEQQCKTLHEQYMNLYKEVEALKTEVEQLNELRIRQEELLGKIFNDNYGSAQEWEMEMDLDLLGTQKERIRTAHHRWSSAKVFLSAAIKQLAWSANRWAQISTHHVEAVLVSIVTSIRTCSECKVILRKFLKFRL